MFSSSIKIEVTLYKANVTNDLRYVMAMAKSVAKNQFCKGSCVNNLKKMFLKIRQIYAIF